jgi:hypothetical protein
MESASDSTNIPKRSCFPRIPIPGRRTLLIYQVLPFACLAIHFLLLRSIEQDNSKGITPITCKNQTPCLDFGIIAAVPFLSGPKEFDTLKNVNIQFFDNLEGKGCAGNQIPLAQPGNLSALVIDKIVDCYPEEVARNAKEAGYAAVIYQSPFKVAGYSATSLWRANESPIPLLEVNFEAKLAQLSTVDVAYSPNPYFQEKFFWVVVAYAVVCAFFGFLQVLVAFEMMRDIKCSKMKSRAFCCILQILSGLLRFVFAIDMCGYFHRLPFPFFLLAITIGVILAFSSIISIGSIFHFALLFTESKKMSSSKLFWFMLILVVPIIGFLLALLYAASQFRRVLNSGLLFVLDGSIIVAFQILSAFYFLYTRSRVVRIMQLSSVVSQTRAAQVQRMAQYMYLSLIPMFGFLVCMGIYGLFYYERTLQIASISCAVMFLSLTEVTLMCSFPKKTKKSADPMIKPQEQEIQPAAVDSVPRVSSNNARYSSMN